MQKNQHDLFEGKIRGKKLSYKAMILTQTNRSHHEQLCYT